MDKEIFGIISFCLNLTFLICNILAFITKVDYFKEILIVETCLIPFLYFIVFIIGYLVEKDII